MLTNHLITLWKMMKNQFCMSTENQTTIYRNLCFMGYERHCLIRAVGTWKDHHSRCLLTAIWLVEWSITWKATCFGKAEKVYSSAWQCNGKPWKSTLRKKTIVKMEASSIVIKFNTYRFSFVSGTRIFHHFINGRSFRNKEFEKQIFESFFFRGKVMIF